MRHSFTFIHTEEEDPKEKIYTQVNDYLIIKKIGQGAYSKVYKAIDTVTGINYAIKRVDLNGVARTTLGMSHFERELTLMRRFNQTNILQLHEVLYDEDTNIAYLVIEYADIGSLDSFVGQRKTSDVFSKTKKIQSNNSIFSIIKQVATALKYIHSKGYVHQDIKPANILLTSEGKALIADFGVGHSFQSSDQVIGTPAYQPPEVIPDEISDDYSDSDDFNGISEKNATKLFKDNEEEREPEKEDVWALGVTLYQLLYSKLPFVGSNIFEIVRLAKEEELQIPSGTDPLVEELLRGMLQIKPSNRFSIAQILKHPLIASAPDKFTPSSPKDSLVAEIPSSNITKIKASVCGKSFSFAFRKNRRYSDVIETPISPIARSISPFYCPKMPNQPSSIPSKPPL